MSTLYNRELDPLTRGSLSGDVAAYCLKHALSEPLSIARDLVAKYFRPRVQPQVELIEDAESGATYLELQFTAQGELAELIAAYDNLTQEWVDKVVAGLRRHFRFSFSVS